MELWVLMTKQFWVNNYFIDVSRNQIQHQQQATALPPKALKVLEVLASRAGEVVSHDELMDIVWENSVVGPNTLQRAIAQLRKAFGDDSKQQAFIKTHAKQGYSLEARVRWEESPPRKEQTPPNTLAKRTNGKPAYAIAALLFLSVVVTALWPESSPLFTTMTPLTASDEQEFNAAYSPDGNYLAFNRYIGQCESHLWAKDLRNNQEERLSAEPGHYSGLSWSADGSQLAFILQSNCSDKPESTGQCWQLQTVDFAEAWHGNGNALTRYDCKDIETSQPTWLNDGRIAFLQYPSSTAVLPSNAAPGGLHLNSDHPRVMIYNAVTDQLQEVAHNLEDRIYSLAYSRATNVFATVSVSDSNQHIVRIFTLTGEIITEAKVNTYKQHSVYDSFPVSFSPDGSNLLTSVRGKIYQLTFDGELNGVHPNTFKGLWSPVFHPNKQKFAATFGTKDFDIGVLETRNDDPELSIITRSTESEANAQFQPNGDLIAFFSNRSGSNQLWLIDGQSSYQLTNIEQGTKTARFSWSADGTQLVANIDHQIALIAMDGSYTFINSPELAVNTLMPWTHSNKLLVTDNQNDDHRLFSVDITNAETLDLDIQNVLWAAYTADEKIIYADRQNEFWLYSSENTKPLPQLSQQLFGNDILIKQDYIYGINSQAKLWRYDIKSDALLILNTLDKDIKYISDIRGQQMLATKFIGGRRELVEFSK